MMLLTPAYQGLLWLIARHYRTHRGSLRTLLWLGAALAIVVALNVLGTLAKKSAGINTVALVASLKVLFGCLYVLALVEWSAFTKAALAIATPPGAMLVPGLQRHLLRLVAGTWLLLTLVAGTIMRLTFSLDLLACLALSALLLSADAARRAMPLLFWAAIVAAISMLRLNFASGYAIGAVAAAFMKQGSGAPATLALALLLGGGALLYMFRRRHTSIADRLRALFNRPRRAGGRLRLDGLNAWFGRPLLMAGWRRAVRQRQPRALLGYCLGPRAHWSMLALPVVLLALMLLLPSSSGSKVAHREGLRAFILLLCGGLNVGLMTFMVREAALASYRTRAVQALVGLAPGVPQGRARQLAIAHVQLRNVLVAWGLLLLVNLADSGGPDPDGLRLRVAAILFSLLLLVPLALRQHAPADAEADHAVSMWAPVGLLALLGIVYLIDFSRGVDGWSWYALFVSPLICFIEVRRRLRAIGARPAAPASRGFS